MLKNDYKNDWGVDSFHIFREFSLGFYALFKSVLCFKFCFEDTDI